MLVRHLGIEPSTGFPKSFTDSIDTLSGVTHKIGQDAGIEPASNSSVTSTFVTCLTPPFRRDLVNPNLPSARRPEIWWSR